ncbi:MAG TPA: hypothetical protein VN753_13370 [Terracidiphilus sp.]|nr:hypothetical protein [Terracidiphilus sp.]
MRLARGVAKALLIYIVLCEMAVAWRLWRHGPPMEMVTTGEQSFKWVRTPLSSSDWTIFAAVIALQVALMGFLWWSRRPIARN